MTIRLPCLLLAGSRAVRHLLRVWGEGYSPSDETIEKQAEKFELTNMKKHLQKGDVTNSLWGVSTRKISLSHNLQLPPCVSQFIPENVLQRKGSIPFSETWLKALWLSATDSPTPFGHTMSRTQILCLLQNIDNTLDDLPQCQLDYPPNKDIIVSSGNILVPKESGWKFPAGEILRRKRATWVAASSTQAQQLIRTILTSGWNPGVSHNMFPTWFRDHSMTELEQKAWDKEVYTLLRMGAIKKITRDHVTKFGLPQVVLPIFLVEESDKYRPIIDARFANLPFLPPWFSLPKIQNFVSSLSKDTFWFKCDVKGGWHHVPIDQDHSNFFAFKWRDRLYQYNVCAFGDSTAPYVFTYLLITLKRMLNARGIKGYTLYIDDLLHPGSTNLRKAHDIRTQVINAQLELNLALGAKKCPPPSKCGEAFGFWIDTKLGIITFTRQKLQKIIESTRDIENTWSKGRKVHVP